VKTTKEVLEETGLTYPMLNRLRDLHILPRPKIKGLGRRKGVISEYDDSVINIINWVKLHQERGLSLSEIAELRRKELDEVEVIKPTEDYLIPLKSDPAKSYLDAYDNLYDWLQRQIKQQVPGYELYGVYTEKVIRNGEEFLKPKVIRVRPKTKKKVQRDNNARSK
jgi:DNA-binding transcriptional MerR regulator